MKFNKTQKKHLKQLGLWKRVKELTNEDMCRTSFNKHTTLLFAFIWEDTSEGDIYWSNIDDGLYDMEKQS